MSHITLRPALPEDALRLAACFDAAWAPWRVRLPDLPDVTGGLAEDIRDNRVIVADAGEQILGGIVLVSGKDALHVANLAVDPQAAGQGLARRLMEAAEGIARSDGHTRMQLATHKDMPGNVALYQHLGWTVTARGPRKIEMEKRL